MSILDRIPPSVRPYLTPFWFVPLVPLVFRDRLTQLCINYYMTDSAHSASLMREITAAEPSPQWRALHMFLGALATSRSHPSTLGYLALGVTTFVVYSAIWLFYALVTGE